MADAKAQLETYEKRAAEARAKSAAMSDLEAKQTMLRVAELWDSMAAAARRPHVDPTQRARPTVNGAESAPGKEQEQEQPATAGPATLGDVLYARSRPLVAEQEWAALVQLIAAGDEVALHALYERSHRIVFTLVLRLTANRETAEELTIDVFHDIWRRASAYDAANGTVLGWIMNQARSRAIDRLRFESRRKRTQPDDMAAQAEPVADLRDVMALREQGAALRAALAALTPDERQAIETTFFGGLTHAEAAERLKQPLGTIKTRIRSALHKLRQALAAQAGQA
jgi:RNA polymerase sigma-70 factor (ECF subfamily)